jgi:hypothetical protein
LAPGPRVNLDLDVARHILRDAAAPLRIAANTELVCAPGHKLPPCWTILYELSKLTPEVLKASLADESIHPGMTRKEAIALREPPKDPENEDGGEHEAPTSPAPKFTTFADAWDAASRDEIRAKLDQVGRAGLCSVLSPELLDDLREHILNANKLSAPKLSVLPVGVTDKLHVALRSAELPNPDSEAVGHMVGALKSIAQTAERRKIARSDLVIAKKR